MDLLCPKTVKLRYIAAHKINRYHRCGINTENPYFLLTARFGLFTPGPES
jgi:hypothetical protein